MADLPQSAVIVGGSLAGLLHGIFLKRHGVDVVLLEQEPTSIRTSNNAGIGFGPHLEEFLQTYDLSKIRNCTPAATPRIAYRKRKDFYELKVQRHTSSWGLMYRIMRANFDDVNNVVHYSTVPAGLVRREVWSKHLAAHLHTMAEPFAEVVSKCKNPFVTKVNDALSEKAGFYDGHVVLVGDALCTVRPHLAAATEQAAGHCLDLGKVWHREMTMEQWEKKTLMQAKRLWLACRATGIFGVGGWWALLRILGTYLVFMIKLKRSKL